LGDKYGIREVAMVGWILAAITNSGLALIEPWWSNTTLMTAYLCLRAFLFGIAWISVISICMRLTYSKAGGTQFTAYMSMFNLSGVITLLLTGELLLHIDYISALYLGGALTLVTVVLLVFIDPEECDRVLEGRIGNQEEFDGDLGESGWWEKPTLDAILEVEEFGETTTIT
jgi:MFS family permease